MISDKPMYEKLRDYIDERGVSRKYVAINMKTSESRLSLILSGKRKLSADEFVVLCQAIAVDPRRFYDDVNTSQNHTSSGRTA